jgi:Flp pilus assembly protein TadG
MTYGLSPKKNNGQALVEFALAIPLVLFLIMGVIGFGHMFFTYITVVSASREGARTGIPIGNTVNGIPYYKDCAVIRAAAKRVGTFAGIQDANITITYDHGPSTTQSGTCPVSGTGPTVNTGDRIIVQVSILYKPFFPFVKLPQVTITTTTRHTIVN